MNSTRIAIMNKTADRIRYFRTLKGFSQEYLALAAGINPAYLGLIERSVKQYISNPRVALLSYSNFGSNDGPIPEKTREAVSILHKQYPDMVIDGEMQANFAINTELLKDNYPFSTLNGQSANTLIFPNLESGNIAYKLLQELGSAEAVGPILLGLNKPVHVLQLGSSVREIVNMITIAVVDAQAKEGK